MGHKYNGPEVDVWSMGIVLFSMITGIFPFENVADIIHGNFMIPENISISNFLYNNNILLNYYRMF